LSVASAPEPRCALRELRIGAPFRTLSASSAVAPVLSLNSCLCPYSEFLICPGSIEVHK
jgi:hypothetical protein